MDKDEILDVIAELSPYEIIKVIEEIYNYCSVVSECDNCMFANGDNTRCNLKGVPWKWDINDIKKENRGVTNG